MSVGVPFPGARVFLDKVASFFAFHHSSILLHLAQRVTGMSSEEREPIIKASLDLDFKRMAGCDL